MSNKWEEEIKNLEKMQEEHYKLLEEKDKVNINLEKLEDAYKRIFLHIWTLISEKKDEKGKLLFTNDRLRENEYERIKKEEYSKYEVGGLNIKQLDEKIKELKEKHNELKRKVWLGYEKIELKKIYLQYNYEDYKQRVE